MKTIAKRFLLIVSLLLIIYFLPSCKKSVTPGSLPIITTTNVTIVSRTSATINANINSTGTGSLTATGVCFATTQNPTIANSSVASTNGVGSITVTLVGLTGNTTYYARPFATNTTGTAYGNQLIFVTPSVSFNLAKYYNSLGNYYYNSAQIASVVGATHVVFGSGFTTPDLAIKLISRTNATDIIKPITTVTNDSTLSFKIPSDLVIGQNPYVAVKEYYLTINNVVFRSQYGFYNPSIVADSAIFQVVNKQLNIASVKKITNSPCNVYAIYGFFASSKVGFSYNPAIFLGVPTMPGSQRLIVKAGGVFFKDYPITKSNANCGETAFIVNPTNQILISFHDPAQLTLKDMLPTGNISLQLENKMDDGTLALSNEFTFVN